MTEYAEIYSLLAVAVGVVVGFWIRGKVQHLPKEARETAKGRLTGGEP